MASQAYSGTATIGTTEWSLTNNSSSLGSVTTAGSYQAVIDLVNLAVGDIFEFSIYEKVVSGATQRRLYHQRFADAQSDPNKSSYVLVLLHGWEATLKKITGTDRSITFSIRSVA